jgi:hypothetical protein
MNIRKKLFSGIILTTILFISMGFFSFLKNTKKTQTSIEPYKESSTNLIYNLLFCDNIDLYKENTEEPYTYPFDILFSDNSSENELQKIIDDKNSDPRVKTLAYNILIIKGVKPTKKELLAVIVEVGLENGLDVLASFSDGTARYINQTEKILVWEKRDDIKANEITEKLFENSQKIVQQIGAWDKPRRPNPTKGNVRITFLVSDGLYFGEGPIDVLFNDQMANPALTNATELMKYLTEKSLDSRK